MFCTKCGASVPDNAAFCGSCGSRLAQRPAPAVAVQPQAPTPPAKATSRKPFPKAAAMAAVAVAVVAACAAGLLLWQNAAKHAKHELPVTIEAVGYNAGADTRFPVMVTGSKADGAAVEELFFIESDGHGVEIAPGSYEVSFPAGPITASGDVFAPLSPGFKVEVSSDLKKGEPIAVASEATAGYQVISADQLTQEQVDQAYSYAQRDEKNKQRADQNKAAADAVVQKVKLEKEEAQRKAAEEEAERKRAAEARSFSCEYFTINPPESFGTVTYRVRTPGSMNYYGLEVTSSALGKTWTVVVSRSQEEVKVNIGMEAGTCSSGLKVYLTGTDYEAHDRNSKLKPYVTAL